MFLSSIEARQGLKKSRFEELKQLLMRAVPPKASTPGVTNGLRLPYRIRDRLVQVQSRHQLGSVKETTFKALMIGLVTLERMPPMVKGCHTASPDDFYRVNRLRPLSEEEISRLREEGFNAPRVPQPSADEMPSFG